MSDRLPEIIEPLHLADTRGELKGKISLSSLDRLAKMLVNDSGTIDVDLFFGREGRLAKVEGHIETVLALQCQNCLEAVEWPIDCDIKLGIVTSIDQANRLSEEYEPLMVEEEKIPLKNIIEDEILLNLPAFPKHQHPCIVATINNDTKKTVVFDDTSSTTKNPFSILAKVKNTGDL